MHKSVSRLCAFTRMKVASMAYVSSEFGREIREFHDDFMRVGMKIKVYELTRLSFSTTRRFLIRLLICCNRRT